MAIKWNRPLLERNHVKSLCEQVPGGGEGNPCPKQKHPLYWRRKERHFCLFFIPVNYRHCVLTVPFLDGVHGNFKQPMRDLSNEPIV